MLDTYITKGNTIC